MAEYEIHLDDETEEWIIVCDGVEVARYVHATDALAQVRLRLEEQGDDAWDFGLGIQCDGGAAS